MFGDFINNLPTQAKLLGGVGLGLWVLSEFKGETPFANLLIRPVDSLMQLAGIAIGIFILNCISTSSESYCDQASWFLVVYVLYGVGNRLLKLGGPDIMAKLPHASEFRNRYIESVNI
jgi:hypothetical protein